ncbi:MAG: hypothetical protein QM621_10635 [Aeromicrobium sp.]|uniref:hypothetical protein n=1 Tax=Aeromicrobium sp. TaxID=1871063 RepID=UPI0039E388A5
MSDAQALAQIQELDEIISRLASVLNDFAGFDFSKYREAGSGLWKGEKARAFSENFNMGLLGPAGVLLEIGAAISECRAKQLALASSMESPEMQAAFAPLMYFSS